MYSPTIRDARGGRVHPPYDLVFFVSFVPSWLICCYSRDFNTATRSRWSRFRRTINPEIADAIMTTSDDQA